METIRNIGVAGLSIEMQKRLIAQVVVPDPKEENKPSPKDREFRVIFHCAQFLRDIGTMIKETERFPHQWTKEDIRWFNEYFGGNQTITFLPPRFQRANLLDFTVQEHILPSPDDLIQNGCVDLDAIKQL